MRLSTQYLTQNDCYKAGKACKRKRVMLHSTGANNPKVSRYVPGNDELGRNAYGNHWDRPGVSKCVHAIIGLFADGGVGTVQTLPWTMRSWHAAKKQGNDECISIEICEDGLTDASYFAAVYREAVEVTAMLCEDNGLDPMADGVVICHAEGYKLGLASNHGDVLHWFPKHGKTMDDFRRDVAAEMTARKTPPEAADSWAQAAWQKAYAAGVMDGTRPRAAVSRQELALILSALDLT